MSREYSPCSEEQEQEYGFREETDRNSDREKCNQIKMSDSDSEEAIVSNETETIKNEEQIDVLNRLPKRSVPNANVPEKVIICIDACQAVDSSLFFLEHGTTFTPHNMLKRITEFFVYSKQAINVNTEFALIVLKESEPHWIQNFTKNIPELIASLDSFDPEEYTGDEFELSKLFNLVSEKVTMPDLSIDYKLVPPSNTVRLILMYNRSDCTLKSPAHTPVFDFLKDHLYFTVDILYTHENNCASHKCEEIYDILQSVDNGYSYMFEVTRNAAKLHECMAKLLAHPLQRPLQKHASYMFDK